jgi:hypothetical protein
MSCGGTGQHWADNYGFYSCGGCSGTGQQLKISGGASLGKAKGSGKAIQAAIDYVHQQGKAETVFKHIRNRKRSLEKKPDFTYVGPK